MRLGASGIRLQFRRRGRGLDSLGLRRILSLGGLLLGYAFFLLGCAQLPLRLGIGVVLRLRLALLGSLLLANCLDLRPQPLLLRLGFEPFAFDLSLRICPLRLRFLSSDASR